jgi:hypothetical protein
MSSNPEKQSILDWRFVTRNEMLRENGSSGKRDD